MADIESVAERWEEGNPYEIMNRKIKSYQMKSQLDYPPEIWDQLPEAAWERLDDEKGEKLVQGLRLLSVNLFQIAARELKGVYSVYFSSQECGVESPHRLRLKLGGQDFILYQEGWGKPWRFMDGAMSYADENPQEALRNALKDARLFKQIFEKIGKSPYEADLDKGPFYVEGAHIYFAQKKAMDISFKWPIADPVLIARFLNNHYAAWKEDQENKDKPPHPDEVEDSHSERKKEQERMERETLPQIEVPKKKEHSIYGPQLQDYLFSFFSQKQVAQLKNPLVLKFIELHFAEAYEAFQGKNSSQLTVLDLVKELNLGLRRAKKIRDLKVALRAYNFESANVASNREGTIHTYLTVKGVRLNVLYAHDGSVVTDKNNNPLWKGPKDLAGYEKALDMAKTIGKVFERVVEQGVTSGQREAFREYPNGLVFVNKDGEEVFGTYLDAHSKGMVDAFNQLYALERPDLFKRYYRNGLLERHADLTVEDIDILEGNAGGYTAQLFNNAGQITLKVRREETKKSVLEKGSRQLSYEKEAGLQEDLALYMKAQDLSLEEGNAFHIDTQNKGRLVYANAEGERVKNFAVPVNPDLVHMLNDWHRSRFAPPPDPTPPRAPKPPRRKESTPIEPPIPPTEASAPVATAVSTSASSTAPSVTSTSTKPAITRQQNAVEFTAKKGTAAYAKRIENVVEELGWGLDAVVESKGVFYAYHATGDPERGGASYYEIGSDGKADPTGRRLVLKQEASGRGTQFSKVPQDDSRLPSQPEPEPDVEVEEEQEAPRPSLPVADRTPSEDPLLDDLNREAAEEVQQAEAVAVLASNETLPPEMEERALQAGDFSPKNTEKAIGQLMQLINEAGVPTRKFRRLKERLLRKLDAEALYVESSRLTSKSASIRLAYLGKDGNVNAMEFQSAGANKQGSVEALIDKLLKPRTLGRRIDLPLIESPVLPEYVADGNEGGQEEESEDSES